MQSRIASIKQRTTGSLHRTGTLQEQILFNSLRLNQLEGSNINKLSLVTIKTQLIHSAFWLATDMDRKAGSSPREVSGLSAGTASHPNKLYYGIRT